MPKSLRARNAMPCILAVALLATACARPHDALVARAPWKAPPDGMPATVVVVPGTDATFVPPTPPAPRTGGEVAARTAGAAVIYPIAGVLGAGMCGPAAILCAPVFLAFGIGYAAAEAGRGAQAVRTPEEVAAADAILRHVADPARLGTCLRRTLVERSSGRLVAAPEQVEGAALRVALEAIWIAARQHDTDLVSLGDLNPEIVLNVTANARLAAQSASVADTPPGARAVWHWAGEPRRYYAVTSEGGRALQADLDLAIGVLAQRILADLFPGSFPAPPSRAGDDASRYRANCPLVAQPVAAVQTVPAEVVR